MSAFGGKADIVPKDNWQPIVFGGNLPKITGSGRSRLASLSF